MRTSPVRTTHLILSRLLLARALAASKAPRSGERVHHALHYGRTRCSVPLNDPAYWREGAPAVRGCRVCRMHGAGGGAPTGNRNGNYRHGTRTKEAIQAVRLVNLLSRLARKS